MNREEKQRRHGRGPRVASLLLFLALVPLAGTAWFAVIHLSHIDESVDRATEIAEKTETLVLLSALQARLHDERNWALAAVGVVEVGLDVGTVELLTGTDIQLELSTAETEVDRYLADLGQPEITRAVAEIRQSADASLADRRDLYDALILLLGDQSTTQLAAMISSAGTVDHGDHLVASLTTLNLSLNARRAVTAELSGFFGSSFSSVITARRDVESLIADRYDYDTSMRALQASPKSGQFTGPALDAILASDDKAAFEQRIDDTIRALIDGDRTVDEASTADLGMFAATFFSGNEMADLHLALVQAAGQEVRFESAELQRAADADLEDAVLVALLVIGVSVLCALAIARFLVSPLERLADAAMKLRDGDQAAELAITGPLEVREASQAINEAQVHIQLAEDQANALAAGELDSPVLEANASGSLGASLQAAVRTLAASLGEREAFRQRLAHEASHDGLTNLPNRNHCLAKLEDGLARSRANEAMIAVMFIDLDRFKEINDHHGHPAGDAVLREVAERLNEQVRNGDHVGRLGGDEFVVVAEPVRDASEAVRLAERIAASVSAPIDLGYAVVRVGASVGVAIADGRTIGPFLTGDELLRDADLAVYQAKTSGRVVELCNDDLRARVDREAELEHALSDAVVTNGLTVSYQPIVDTATGATVARLARVRWATADGDIAPREFLSIAQRSDLIIDLDCWVLDTVCGQLADWAKEEVATPAAVNISNRHLMSDEFVSHVRGAIEAHGIDPSLLTLEVSEEAVLGNIGNAGKHLQELRDGGVRVSIDDFGSSYRSLPELHGLPIDEVKIDSRLTGDDAMGALVKLIVETSCTTGVTITAEAAEAIRLPR